MTEEVKCKINNFRIFLFILIIFTMILAPLIWLLPLPIGTSVEFNMVYANSTYFTNEPAVGIDVLVDGVYYGPTDALGSILVRANDQNNHTFTIDYNNDVIYQYLIEYNTSITTVNVVLDTKGIDAVFRWDYGSNDLAVGEQIQLWYNRAGTFELLGIQTTDRLGTVAFAGLIMGEYTFVGVTYGIPETLIELNQSTATNTENLLIEPITQMFDFDYSNSTIFGNDTPVTELQYSISRWIYNSISKDYSWITLTTGTTNADGRIYFYNLQRYNDSNVNHGTTGGMTYNIT